MISSEQQVLLEPVGAAVTLLSAPGKPLKKGQSCRAQTEVTLCCFVYSDLLSLNQAFSRCLSLKPQLTIVQLYDIFIKTTVTTRLLFTFS